MTPVLNTNYVGLGETKTKNIFCPVQSLENQAIIANLALQLHQPGLPNVDVVFLESFYIFISKIDKLNHASNQAARSVFDYTIKQLTILHHWSAFPSIKALTMNRVEELMQVLSGKSIPAFNQTSLLDLLDLLVAKLKFDMFSLPECVHNDYLNSYFCNQVDGNSIDQILIAIEGLLTLHPMYCCMRQVFDKNFKLLEKSVKDKTFISLPAEHENLMLFFLEATNEVDEKWLQNRMIQHHSKVQSGINFGSTSLDILNSIRTPIFSYFQNSPSKFFRGCILSPNSALSGGLAQLKKAYIHISDLNCSGMKGERSVQLYIVKKDLNLPNGYFCGILNCNLSKKGLSYPLSGSKSSSDDFNLDAKHNFALLQSCYQKYASISYANVQQVCNSIIGIQIPGESPISSEKSFKTHPVVLVSVNVLQKKLEEDINCAVAIKQAIEQEQKVIEGYPDAKSLMVSIPAPAQSRTVERPAPPKRKRIESSNFPSKKLRPVIENRASIPLVHEIDCFENVCLEGEIDIDLNIPILEEDD